MKMRIQGLTATILVATIFTSVIAYFLLHKHETEHPHCKEVAFPKDEKNCVFYSDTISKMRKYKSYFLSKDPVETRSILEKAEKDLNTIKQNKDTLNGIDIVLNDNSTYQDLIYAFDICSKTQPHFYGKCMNHVYGWYSPVNTLLKKEVKVPPYL